MDFRNAYREWLASHLNRRTGERKARLKRGHAHAEELFCKNIWWPLKGSFDHLHPEYEILDMNGAPYYADFVYKKEPLIIIIEIKGFAVHVRNMTRQGYQRELSREFYLKGLGYRVIVIAYDDVEQQPDKIISLLRMLLSRFEPSAMPVQLPLLEEAEAFRLACALSRPIRPIDVCEHFRCNYRTAHKWLTRLAEKGWLIPKTTGERVCQYEVRPHAFEYWS